MGLPRLRRALAKINCFDTLYFSMVFFRFFKHLVSPGLPVVCDCPPACLHVLLSLGIAQKSSLEPAWCLSGKMCLIPNFSASRDLLISFMLSLISECWGPACFVLTQWNFLCGETYTADSLHQLKTDLCLQRKKHHPFLSYFSLVILDLLLLQNTSYLLEQAAAHRLHRSSL